MLTTLDQLETLYGLPQERALRKEIAFLTEDYQAMVKASPLVIVSSSGADGLDGSPRGDVPGFVRIIDERTGNGNALLLSARKFRSRFQRLFFQSQ